MSETTNLRQADAFVNVLGVLSEKNLEEEVITGNVKRIKGYLVLKTSETDSITFSVNVFSKKKNGENFSSEENKNYAGIQTVLREYKSMVNNEGEADIVRVSTGTIRPYFNAARDREMISYNSNFFTRVTTPVGKDEFRAKFEVEAFINTIVPEFYTTGDKAGFETGRAIVKCWLPTFNGIEPIELIAPEEDGIAEAIMNGDYTPGQTVRFYGDIVNRRIVKTTVVPVRIGKPKEETNVTFINELVITGASEPYDAESADPNIKQPFDAGAIKLAVAERERRVKEMKENAEKNSDGWTTAKKANSSEARALPW